MSVGIIRFDRHQAEVESGRPDRVLAGDPATTTHNHYTSADGRFFAGTWESSAGKWAVHYTENEFVHMLAGEAILTGEDGRAQHVRAGDSFVVPAGFTGTWESLGKVKKLYAIYQ